MLQTDRGWGWSLMFFGLLNEDQTPGFWPKPPPSLSTLSRGTAVIEGPVQPKKKKTPPSYSSFLLIYTPHLLPFPPLLFLISLPGIRGGFITSLAQMNGGSNVFSSAPLGGPERSPYGRPRARHSAGNSAREVPLRPEWTLTLKHVYVNLWQGKGSGQMSRQGGLLTKPLTSEVLKSKADQKHVCRCL